MSIRILPKVNRVEVINHAVPEGNPLFGRSYVFWDRKAESETSVSLQDDGRTLKVFISKVPDAG